ncbi:MAG: hypothetical protein Roseis2KO_09510 [Roseivirga sp.]
MKNFKAKNASLNSTIKSFLNSAKESKKEFASALSSGLGEIASKQGFEAASVADEGGSISEFDYEYSIEDGQLAAYLTFEGIPNTNNAVLLFGALVGIEGNDDYKALAANISATTSQPGEEIANGCILVLPDTYVGQTLDFYGILLISDPQGNWSLVIEEASVRIS